MTDQMLQPRSISRFSLLLLFCFLPGCQQYGEVSSKSYEFAKALYSICNRKDTARLEMIDTAITDAVAAEELPADEAEDLQDIIKRANDGEWSAAMLDCRTLMSEQNVQT